MCFDSQGNYLLAPLLAKIKENGFDLDGKIIQYFSEQDQAHVFVGKDPISDDFSIEATEIGPESNLEIRVMPSNSHMSKKPSENEDGK